MSRTDRPDILDWFGLRRRSVRTLGVVLSALVIVLFAMAVIAAFGVLAHAIFGLGFDAPRTGFGTGAVIVTLLSAPFVIWRAVVAQRQADIAQEGHITDRIGQAVEQLGHDNIAVRMGAIHSLERIMRDSEDDRVMVMRTLNAYLHNRSAELPPAEPDEVPDTPIDVDAALSVIGRWNKE